MGFFVSNAQTENGTSTIDIIPPPVKTDREKIIILTNRNKEVEVLLSKYAKKLDIYKNHCGTAVNDSIRAANLRSLRN